MISKDEIDQKAVELDVHVANVQRDYIFGWLLKAIAEHPYLGSILILKGGNCFRKVYYPDARYSDDLDFSTEVALDGKEFQAALVQCCEKIQAMNCVNFDSTRNTFSEEGPINFSGESRHKVYKARVYFQDFYGESSSLNIAVRLDISEFDKIYLPTKSFALVHPYTDANLCHAQIRCLSLEEMLANKMKCLLQRRHSHDLFDMVYAFLWQNHQSLNRAEILSVFLKKTIFRASPISAKNLFLGLPFDYFKHAWQRYVMCPIPGRFDFESAAENFKSFIDELFPGNFERNANNLAFFPAELRNPIMDAARNQTLLRVTYGGVTRLVEPYALTYKRRQDNVAQEYFYCWDTTGGENSGPGVKTFLNQKISSIETTDETFEPRFEIELSKAGEAAKVGHFSGRQSARLTGLFARPKRSTQSFTVQCPYCQKKFKRTTASLTLKAHKTPDGYQCNGRQGYRTL